MGLDIALVGGGGPEAAFDDVIRSGETRLQIAVAERGIHGDIVADVAGDVLLTAAVLYDRRAGLHRLVHIRHVGQGGVVHPDQFQRLSGGGHIRGRDPGDGVAVIERLAAREAVVGHVAHELVILGCKVVMGDDRLHPRQGQRLGGVDGIDRRMGMRRAQDEAREHTRQGEVRAILGAARDLVDAVGAGNAGAQNLEVGLDVGWLVHAVSPRIWAAATWTALMILS